MKGSGLILPRNTFRKIITSPELIEKINPVNKKLVERYLKNFNTKRSDASVEVYRSNYNIFFCWNEIYNDNISFIDIKKSQMLDFFDFCVSELKWSPNRYSQMWSSLSSLSNFIDDMFTFINEEKKEKTQWEFFLHKVYDKTWKEFIDEINISNEEKEIDLGATLKKSKNMLKNFTPESEV